MLNEESLYSKFQSISLILAFLNSLSLEQHQMTTLSQKHQYGRRGLEHYFASRLFHALELMEITFASF